MVKNGIIEPLNGSETTETLQIRNLMKDFSGKTAVNNLSLTLFKD